MRITPFFAEGKGEDLEGMTMTGWQNASVRAELRRLIIKETAHNLFALISAEERAHTS